MSDAIPSNRVAYLRTNGFSRDEQGNGNIMATFAIDDEAQQVYETLRMMGIRCEMGQWANPRAPKCLSIWLAESFVPDEVLEAMPLGIPPQQTLPSLPVTTVSSAA